ncbi:MAG: class F sortase [Corynebacteriales bacterium]|nr:class F sortase [Mycobacteriales bacterium]
MSNVLLDELFSLGRAIVRHRPTQVAVAVVTIMAGAFSLGMGVGQKADPWTLPDFSIKTRKVSSDVASVNRAVPTRIRIKAIGVDAPIDAMGLTSNSTMDVPSIDEPTRTGWYRDGPSPGELGSAVVLGHVDTRSKPAVFHNIGELKAGHRIEIDRDDHSTIVFTVESGKLYDKKRFPSHKVFARPGEATLNLVTCGGRWNKKLDSYSHNIVVFARHTSTRLPDH